MKPVSIPQSTEPLKILCLGAHSDDIEIGCGATLIELAERNPRPEFRWVVWSACGDRAREAALGARAFLWPSSEAEAEFHGFRDGYFPSQFGEIKDAFEVLARDFRPDVVFTHYRDDRHQDHRVISDLTWNTFRNHVILEYEIPKWDGDVGQPNYYIPICREIAERKITSLMKVFQTQRSKDWFSPETFTSILRLRGIESRAREGFAEAFHARKLVSTL
ncbi:MAG: PIG-L deacetylase family protein [Gemmatimonadaceae bacterium]